MLIAAALVVVLVVLAFLVFIDRLLEAFGEERADHARQVESLIQRLQAPDVAVAAYDPNPDRVEPPGDDEEESSVIHDEQDEILMQVKGI